jgi:hypothetical protein
MRHRLNGDDVITVKQSLYRLAATPRLYLYGAWLFICVSLCMISTCREG